MFMELWGPKNGPIYIWSWSYTSPEKNEENKLHEFDVENRHYL